MDGNTIKIAVAALTVIEGIALIYALTSKTILSPASRPRLGKYSLAKEPVKFYIGFIIHMVIFIFSFWYSFIA
jgi:hypothetical protein